MTDHRDSTREHDEIDASRIADDLLLDAILAGRATEDAADLRRRVRAACDAIDVPADRRPTPVHADRRRTSRRIHWRPLAAAAMLLVAIGLLTMVVARPTPAHAAVDASFERLESRDLTFRIFFDGDGDGAADSRDDDARGGRRRPGFARRLDGATLHVRGDRAVMLLQGRDGGVLARGHDGGRFWSNHLPEAIESSIAARDRGGLPFQGFLDAVEGDVQSLLRSFRRGYRIEGGEEHQEHDGSKCRRYTGMHRGESGARGGVRDRSRPGPPERFDLWIDDNGDLQRLRVEGLRGRGGMTMGAMVLELIGTDPLDDAVFDPATYPEIRDSRPSRPTGRRGDHRGADPVD